jgi:topoisomerase-4 subunit B
MMSLNQKLTSYDEGAIETKNDMEWLRLRPENHIRTVDAQGQLHVIKEILDNALDETEIRPNGKVDILLFLDRRKHKWQIAIADNGRGFPFSAFVPAFTVLKTSGKFNRDSYVTSSGLNGFGSKVANALSENLRAITWRDGKIATLHTHHSDVVDHHIENYSNNYGHTGTVVIYEPLDEYFDGVDEFVNDAHSQLFDTARLLGMSL